MVTLRGTVIVDDALEREQVRIEGETLTFAPAPPGAGEEIIEGWILPGLVDVHCHIGFSAEGVADRQNTFAQAHRTTDTGVLLIRDAGMPADTRFLQSTPHAPRIIRAGRHIARPKRYIRELPLDLDDGEDLPEALAAQALAGDGWVKLVGDWIDRDQGSGADLAPLWSADQLRRGFAAAHAAGARVMVHTFAHETIDPLLEAGVDCIEHGCGMSPEQMERAAAAGIPVTPTLAQVENFPAIAGQAARKYPVYAAHMQRLHEGRFTRVRQMHEAGVQILVGSDAGGGVPHGSYHREIDLLREAGLPDRAIVAAASYHARRYLGVPGISEGAPADVVVYPCDPREDARVLRTPLAVFRGGQRLR